MKTGITHIVNLTGHKIQNPHETKFSYLKLNCRDNGKCDLTYYVYATIDFIETQLAKHPDAKFLVHCRKVL
jgi:hypothetical protein